MYINAAAVYNVQRQHPIIIRLHGKHKINIKHKMNYEID